MLAATTSRLAPWRRSVTGVGRFLASVHIPEWTATHEVMNQAVPLEDYNLFSSDVALREAVEREKAGWAKQRLEEFGATVGSAETIERGHQANKNPPELVSFNRFGQRLDVAKYHPAYHDLMRTAIERETHCLPYTAGKANGGGNVARSAQMYMMYQVDAGVTCPISMTYACVPALETTPEVAEEWVPRVCRPSYDPRNLPAQVRAGWQRRVRGADGSGYGVRTRAGEDGRDVGHVNDGEAGRLGRAGEHDGGPAAERG